MSPEQELMRGQYKQQLLREPTEAEVGETLDLITGFALPVIKMKDLGKIQPAWAHLAPAGVRDQIRRMVSKANQIPDKGPQNIANRAEAIKAAGGAVSRYHKQLKMLNNMAKAKHLTVPEWVKRAGPIMDEIEWAKELARPYDIPGGAVLKTIK